MATSADSPTGNRTDSARVVGAVTRLRSAGERVTTARYAVLRVVDAADRADEHLSAEQIGARVAEAEPAVHRATVYRTLTSLVDTGVLSHVHLGGSATVYHLTEPASLEEYEQRRHADARQHAHVQCHECGRVLDVPPELFDDVRRRLLDEIGFVLDTGHAALLGTCRDCQL